jgi:hypothetical protein
MALELVLNTVVPLAEGARLVLYCGTNLLSTEKQNIIHFQLQIGDYIPIVLGVKMLLSFAPPVAKALLSTVPLAGAFALR